MYMANGNKIYFKNMLVENSDYEELSQMHSPKKMLQIIGKKSEYGALPLIEKRGLRDCQYRAEVKFEESLKWETRKIWQYLQPALVKLILHVWQLIDCLRRLTYSLKSFSCSGRKNIFIKGDKLCLNTQMKILEI